MRHSSEKYLGEEAYRHECKKISFFIQHLEEEKVLSYLLRRPSSPAVTSNIF